MSISRDILAYFEELDAKPGEISLSDTKILEILSKQPAFQLFNQRLEKILPEQRVLVLLRALAAQKSEFLPRMIDSELVVTFPGLDSISARHTPQVIRQMIDGATNEVVLAGFALTEESGLLPLMAQAAGRGVKVMLLCSDWRNTVGESADDLVKKNWPDDISLPLVYKYSATRGSTGMHMKSLIIDHTEILLGSANFTFHGLNRNFEMGVRLSGQIAEDARNVIEEFLQMGLFVKVL